MTDELSKDERDKRRKRVLWLRKEGLSFRQIVARVGISDRSVSRIVRQHGDPRPEP
jgi:transposase